MSLLLQALGGGMAAGFGTAANLVHEGMQQQYQNERDRANDLRAQNLMRLKSQLDREEYGAKQDATYSPYTVDGSPATYGDVKGAMGKAADLKKQQGLIEKNVQDRQDKAILAAQAKGETGGTSEADLDAVQAAGRYTDEEVRKLSEKGPQVVNTKEAALEAKLENQKAIADNKLEAQKAMLEQKYEALKEISESKIASAKEIADAKLGMAKIIAEIKIAGKNDPSAVKDMTKGQAATIAARLLKKKSENGGLLDDDEQLLLDTVMEKSTGSVGSGGGGANTKKVATHNEVNDPNQVFGNLAPKSKLLGGGNANAATLSKQTSQFDYNTLPKGSQPVPGKFTKDGRPVFRAPNGQLVAPKLQ